MDGKLLELNHTNGELLNSFDLEIDRCGQSSAIVDNKLAIGGVQGTKVTICFDINSHQKIWTFNNRGHSYIPLISDDKVYQCTEKNIRCLNINSGNLIWEAHEESTYIFNPIVVKDMIVVGGHGLINMYNSQNGGLLHQIKTNVRESIRAIISENDIIYFGDSSGLFYAYRIFQKKNIIGQIKTNSELLWKYNTSGAVESIPVINDDKIMLVNDDNKLICLDKSSGKLNWSFNTKGEAGISGILVEDGNIYTSVGKGYLYKLIEE
jgi:outer membrane protein assembly factor BamB